MYNVLQKFWYNASIRKKIIAFLLVMIFCISVFSIYLIITIYQYTDKFNSNVNGYFKINMLQQNNVNNDRLMIKYFGDLHMDSLADFNQSMDSYYIILQEIKGTAHSLEAYLLIRSIENSFTSYCGESNTAIKKQREGGNDYQIHYYNANHISQYLDSYIAQLLEISLREGNTTYSKMAADAKIMIYIAILMIFIFLLFCLIFGFVFSNYLTKPIEHLAKLSIQMSEGNLNVKAMTIHRNDEVGTLATSFNTMSRNIRQLVYDLREKAFVEKRLLKEELKNIRNKELLKEARFLALQSQINPHFLFNTLNTISRVITFSRSEEAIQLISALASMLRYNMGNSKLHVTLQDELEIIKQYIFIQQYRFGERLKVDIDCSGIETSAIMIPCFTLQPLVENSIIHGLEPKVDTGLLKIKAYMDKGAVVIKIIDNGMGINKEKIELILSMKSKEDTGRTSSIGISNVMNRLAIFCGGKDYFDVKSKVGLGTMVVIRIPIKEV